MYAAWQEAGHPGITHLNFQGSYFDRIASAPAHLASVKTMSSIEIVEVSNKLRAPGRAELRHDTFMLNIGNHRGIAHQNFLGGYFDPNNQQRPCYYLPKREAELMVMSESLDVQTQVYDRLAEPTQTGHASFSRATIVDRVAIYVLQSTRTSGSE